LHSHSFSRFDFNKEPAFKSIKELPTSAKEIINQSKVLFCNGFLFDELSPEVIMSAVDYANESGCMVFFDPGPRGKSLFNGLCSQQLALNKLLNLSNVLLLTADEVS
jgi:sugar/nucleoside kinase (ribokinase family)